MEVFVDTLEADWRKETIQRIIDGINAEHSLAGEPQKYILKTRRLEFADFCAGQLAIEFKEPGDFINSIRDRRLFDQAMGMRMNFENPRIIVNCAYADLFDAEYIRNFHPNAIRALIPSLIFNYKVEVDFTGARGRESFREYMRVYLHKALVGKTIVPHIPVRPAADPKDHMMAMLSCFPGIGEKKVHQIMSKYSSLKDFINDPGKMLTVHGWGNTTIRKIEAVIDQTWNESWGKEDTEKEVERPPVRGIPITKFTQKYSEEQSATWATRKPMTPEEHRREMSRY